jgi:hypothetical protein
MKPVIFKDEKIAIGQSVGAFVDGMQVCLCSAISHLDLNLACRLASSPMLTNYKLKPSDRILHVTFIALSFIYLTTILGMAGR